MSLPANTSATIGMSPVSIGRWQTTRRGGDGDQCRDEELLHVDLVSVHQVPLETVEKLRFDRGATLVH